MRIAGLGLAASLVALWALSAGASSAPAAPAREMQEIFRSSGLEAQLASLDQVVSASLAPNLANVPESQAAVVRRAVLSEFNAPVLQQQVESRLAKRYDPTQAAATLRWLRTPLARRITQIEIEGASAESLKGLAEFAQTLQSMPPTHERLALALDFDRATGWSEFALEVSLASARAAMTAMSVVRPDEPRLRAKEIEAAIDAQREKLRVGLEQASLLSALYVYRNLTDAELQTYLDWARSDAGRWYHGAVRQTLLEVLTEVSARMGHTVATALRAAPGQAPVPARQAQ